MSRSDVRLVAIHFVGRIAHAQAAELHAAIDEPFGADQFVLQGQHKVCVTPESGEEFVSRVALHRAADDYPITYAPNIGVAFPARQRAAIEKADGRDISGNSLRHLKRTV